MDETKIINLHAGIRKQKQLCRILELRGWTASSAKSGVDAYGGWGRKPSGLNARRLANQNNRPFFALEDGFVRSVGLGQRGEPPLSIIMDANGIYYDATQPSDLELRVNDLSHVKRFDTLRARSAMNLLKASRISKYNQTGKDAGLGVKQEGYVLVIDQTKDDPSITYGQASSKTFADMLIAAKRENPGQKIVVKTHPGVLAGVAKGHYSPDVDQVEFLVSNINPWILLEGASKVYTVTSGMGMEALIAGKPVRCFGAPYYAGYGLTLDELELPRRRKDVSLERLFSAAYLEYPIYYDPYQDEITTFERTIDILSFLRDENELNRTKTFCLGMSKWKQPSVAAFLRSTYQEPTFLQSPSIALAKAKASNGRLVIWASKSNDSLDEQCRAEGVNLLKMEDGFLRSKGLGSDLIPPLSLVLDREGIYYDPNHPSELETFIEQGFFTENSLISATNIQMEIIRSGLTKYNVGENRAIENLPLKGEKSIILVPGQVGDDASIRLGTSLSTVKTNLDLLRATRTANPDAFIIYKPHPDVEAGNRYGRISSHKILDYADYIASEMSTSCVLDTCDEVWTLTSLMGLEALIRKKKVVCFGLPFYAGWGLTHDKMSCNRRTRKASLDEIFAAAYLVYSKYIFRGLDGYMRMPAEMAPAILKK
ncbi:capsular polysaccharide biosynthesis protein [Brucella pseudogrignonensis]|uniref:capsular polysaccharide biosynthesis protein n=1 Tax=Brucella pseudogrignonensis TaxID=419475 RepID=UPI003D95209F